MELRHLRYFVAVAEELHFRRAAERLHVAQPAVSEQVRKLEQELGVKLFDRTQRSVALTPSGAAMLEEARRVLRHAEVAQQAARNAGTRATMRLRIGYLADSLPASVPRALRHVSASSPRVDIDLETGPALRLIEELRACRLDAVVTALPAPTSGLRTTLIGEQRAIAVLPAGHRHARSASVDFERLAPERVVVLPRDANPAFHNAVVAMCRAAGLAPTLVETAEPRVEYALLSVATGAGMALVPESAAERYAAPGIRYVALEGAEPAFQTAVLTRPDTDNLPTLSFLQAVTRAARVRSVRSPQPPSIFAAA
ncbi:MAG TPA: LysR family transcriptional regulator [Solirubrobacteraceae bacterium]|jgi:DNA-binding transcriptional LysR family regulator